MPRIIMVRHGQAEINEERKAGEVSTAIGHSKSPLTKKGVMQSIVLGDERFPKQFGIKPREYGRAVAASEFLRPQQTLEYAGFREVHVLPILNELTPPLELVEGRKAIEKHAAERWTPEDDGQVDEFVDRIRSDDLTYEIYGSHGLFIAKLMMKLEAEVGVEAFPHEFDPERGYIPFQTGVVVLDV